MGRTGHHGKATGTATTASNRRADAPICGCCDELIVRGAPSRDWRRGSDVVVAGSTPGGRAL